MSSTETSETFEVTAADTAIALGSGDVEVLATPRLLAWLEAVTVTAARPHLAEGQTSVGTAVRLRHRRPTPVGGRVTVSAVPTTDTEGRAHQLGFTVTAIDDHGDVVASGEIHRAIVERSDFGASTHSGASANDDRSQRGCAV